MSAILISQWMFSLGIFVLSHLYFIEINPLSNAFQFTFLFLSMICFIYLSTISEIKIFKKALHMTIHSINWAAGFMCGFVFFLQRWSSTNCVIAPRRNTSAATTTNEEPFSAWTMWSVTSVTITPVSVLADKLILTDNKEYIQNSILSYYSYSYVCSSVCVQFFNWKTNYIICQYSKEYCKRWCIPQCNMLSLTFHCQK